MESYSRRPRQNNPTGKSPEGASSPSGKNILIFRNRKPAYIHPHPVPARGAFRERHGRRGGDAVDAAARETGDADADGEVVWFRHPQAGVKFAAQGSAGDGGKSAKLTEESTYKP
jgi:hypothetical protein